jgi:O-methyltransferase domain
VKFSRSVGFAEFAHFGGQRAVVDGMATQTEWIEFEVRNVHRKGAEVIEAYVAKSVIHSWNDRDAVRILTNCRHAIRRAGTMLLIERINRGVWAIL